MSDIPRRWRDHGLNPATGFLCGCCAMKMINDESCHCPAPSHPEGLLGKLSADDSIREITVGPFVHEEWCDRWSDRDAECTCGYDSFSSSPCEGCGTPLAGERFTIGMGVRYLPTMQ